MRFRELWPAGALAAIGGAGVVLVVLLGLRLSFFNDDWYILLQRPGLAAKPGLDSFLQPHNGNIVVLFVAVYRAMSWLFGLHSQLPYRVLLGLCVAALGVVIYLIVDSRLGRVTGLVCAAVIVFMGPAWEALLFFAGFGDYATVALGLGAFWLLEHDTPRRNFLACLLLVVSVMTFSIGIPFVAGAAIVVALRRRPRQSWIVAAPAVLFGLWWLGYGSGQPSQVSVANLEHLPRYVIDSCSAGLAALIGFHGSDAGATLRAGHIALVLVVLAGCAALLRRGRPRGWLLVYAGTALCFWLLSGANYSLGREPTASRYVVFDASLLIVMLAELFRGPALARPLRVLVFAAGLCVIGLNLRPLEAGFDFMQLHAAYAKAAIGALQIGESTSRQQLLAPIAQDPFLSGVTPNRYFEVTEASGTPAYLSPWQLTRAPASQRATVDGVLLSDQAVTITPLGMARGAARGCAHLSVPSRGTVVAGPAPPSGVVIENHSRVPLILDLRRFASGFHPVAFLAPRHSLALTLRHDHAPLPWVVAIEDPGVSRAAVSICDRTAEA